MEMATKQIVLDTHSKTFFEATHHAGHPLVMVRYNVPDGDLICTMFRRAADWTRAKGPPRPRETR
jgi:hypothetical protein